MVLANPSHMPVQELDRQRARGATLAVDSPLIWNEAGLEDLLQGGALIFYLASVTQMTTVCKGQQYDNGMTTECK